MQRIIFFDGVCNLCDSVVSKLFKIDKNHRFYFSSLQSETAKKLLKKQDLAKNSIVYFEEGQTYYFADAVIKIFLELGGAYKFAAMILGALPPLISNFMYKIIAQNRYRLFGQKAQCRLPSTAEKAYFLP